MKKTILLTTMGIIIITIGLCAKNKQKVLLKSIVDGDTIKILYYGRIVKCRLIGIDTPECRMNWKTKKDAKRTGQTIKSIIRQGKAAKFYLKSILEKGRYIFIEFDKQKKDRYNRLLVYVYLSDGRMVNKMILQAGYAVPMSIWPCVKYSQEFNKLHEIAKKEHKGLWQK